MPNYDDPEVQRMVEEVFTKDFPNARVLLKKACVSVDKLKELQKDSGSMNEKEE